ncbi:MAG: EutN/CcmL family microcompartment protein [Armatimonadetes bacterium]|nr:EutN/CcmL family microcompartment protein [Armatimonadota bacterium]
MFLGVVCGKVVSTQKLAELEGAMLRVVQPVNHDGTKSGALMIAVDNVQAGDGDLVYLVKGKEAIIPWPQDMAPLDAAIVGIVDGMDLS